jgi:two-component system CheB/CheR fusion protein
VGVILSGTANDGTLGLSAIKNSGGITFAQDLESAKYDGMPTSAVAAGVVDYVMPPDRIAQELIRIQKLPIWEVSSDTFEGKDRLLKEIFRLLKSFSRVDFVDYKVATIRRRILRRMNLNQISELSDYVKLLHGKPEEVEALYRDVLINVTSFFAIPKCLSVCAKWYIPKSSVSAPPPNRFASGSLGVRPVRKPTPMRFRW